MRVPELDELITKLITEDDHPEVVSVESCVPDDLPANHSRVKIRYANGGASTVMVYQVSGPKIPSSAPYTVPREAL